MLAAPAVREVPSKHRIAAPSTYSLHVRVAVLGSVEVLDNGNAVDAGTLKQRALLAALTLHRSRPVSVDALVDLVWGDAPPPAPASSLHGYIAGLRRVLEPGRG